MPSFLFELPISLKIFGNNIGTKIPKFLVDYTHSLHPLETKIG